MRLQNAREKTEFVLSIIIIFNMKVCVGSKQISASKLKI